MSPNTLDLVAGLDWGDQFTLRARTYEVRSGCWTSGADTKGEYVRVPVWSPGTGSPSTVTVRANNKVTNVQKRSRS